ncbi:MAG: D-xylose ABC transporter substrate-binding protein [Granulosicoccus sp.]
MKKTGALLAAASVTALFAGPILADGKTIGVSWSNFQEERWKTDEAAMKAAIEAAGDTYISADAQSSASKQLTDVEALISQGADALILLAQDSGAIGPAVEQAAAEGIPVVGYDRLIENSDAFYITFDNVEVGRMQARAVLEAMPEGNYAFIKGSSSDPNADFLFGGQMEVLKEAMDAGKIKNVGEAYTDGWKPENAQRNMEQILTANDNNIDAVVASNDGTAGGVVAALAAQGLDGSVPVSGQDGDHAALNRVARGTQTVSVWKDARDLGKNAAEIAIMLADGKTMADIPGSAKWSGGPNGVEMNAVFLAPVPVTAANLADVVDAGWIEKDKVCQGAMDSVAACQ